MEMKSQWMANRIDIVPKTTDDKRRSQQPPPEKGGVIFLSRGSPIKVKTTRHVSVEDFNNDNVFGGTTYTIL